MIIDFTHMGKRKKMYAGANGNKICIMYGGEQYMLKFPSKAKKNENMSYSNSCFSEYLGCKIFESVGIPAQKTLLGTYTIGEKQKVVVACKDFTSPGMILQDFGSLKNQMIDSERQGYGTDLHDILQTFEEQMVIDPKVLSDRFWDMFIVDALIGNWDRHNGNWGFLYNTFSDEVALAPVYDCGSCLYAQADDDTMRRILSSEDEIRYRIYEIPTSAITIDGKRIRYFDFCTSCEHNGYKTALSRIVPRIDMEKIKSIIENTPFITEIQKEFFFTMLKSRKEKILDVAFRRLCTL